MTKPKPETLRLPRGKPPKTGTPERKAWEARRAEILALRNGSAVKNGLPVVRRGQPPKDPLERKVWEENNAVARELRQAGISVVSTGKTPRMVAAGPLTNDAQETDAQILARHKETDVTLRDFLHSVAKGDFRALIVSGGPGIGKTVAATEIFNHYKSKEGLRYKKVSGKVSPIMLYKMAYKYRHPNDRLMVDDADGLFFTEDGLNLLKALLDTLEQREPSWNTQTALVDEEGNEVPRSGWVYEGAIVFNTNIDMDRIIGGPASKISDHLRAVVNRSIYFNMRMHTPRELYIWTKYMCESKGILTGPPSYLSKKQEQMALAWMKDHMYDMREISLRSALHVAKFIGKHTSKWESMAAKTLLLRPEQRRVPINIPA